MQNVYTQNFSSAPHDSLGVMPDVAAEVWRYEPLSKLLVSPLIMENQMEKKMENEMETGII